MKRFILFLAIIATQVSTFASTSIVHTTDDGNNLVVAQGKDGKFGYKNNGEKKFKIKPKFVSAEPFSNGLAVVSIDGKEYPEFGVIGIDGKYVIQPKYKAMDMINGGFKVESLSGWGVINSSGEEIIKPIYESVDYLSSDDLWVCIDSNGYLSLCDSTGHFYYGPRQSILVGHLDGTSYFYLDEMCTIYLVETASKIRLLVKDKSARTMKDIFDKGFDEVQYLDTISNKWIMKMRQGNKWGVINMEHNQSLNFDVPIVCDTIDIYPYYPYVLASRGSQKGVYNIEKSFWLGDKLRYKAVKTEHPDDLFLIGDTFFYIYNLKSRAHYSQGSYVYSTEFLDDFSIEPVDLTDKERVYILKTKDGESDEIIYYSTAKDEYISNPKLSDLFISKNWDILTPPIKQKYVKFPNDKLKTPVNPVTGGVLELRVGDNIYSYSSSYSFSSNSGNFKGKVSFYIKEDKSFIYYNVNNKSVKVQDCFSDVAFDNLSYFVPEYMYDLNNNEFIISYHAEYKAGRLFNYAPYQYVMVQGQLWQVNGPSYTQTYDLQGFISLLDKNTLITKKTLALEGIKSPYFWLIDSDVFCWDKQKDFDAPEDFAIEAIGSAKKPIYVLNKNLSAEYKLLFEEGVYILDCWSDSKYLYFCGCDYNNGYVGYANPICLVLDKENHKIVKTIREAEKGNYYSSVYIFNGSLVLTKSRRGMKEEKRFVKVADILN